MKDLPATSYLEDTIKLKQTIEVSFLTLGERLTNIRDEMLWIDHYTNFEEFLLEAKISMGTASKLINIYKKFYLEWQFPAEKLVQAGGWSVVARLLPVAKTKEEAEEWLHKSHILTRQDLDKEIKELTTGIEMSKCDHKDHYVIRVCRTCGDRESVYEN